MAKERNGNKSKKNTSLDIKYRNNQKWFRRRAVKFLMSHGYEGDVVHKKTNILVDLVGEYIDTDREFSNYREAMLFYNEELKKWMESLGIQNTRKAPDRIPKSF